MISGYGCICGFVKVKVKIFLKSRNVWLFVLDNNDFDHDILIGLDLIKEFRLCQDENLNVFQKLNSGQFYYKSGKPRPIINYLNLQADLSHLDNYKKCLIDKTINELFNRAFAKDKFDVGQVKDHEAQVKLTEHRYIYRKPYRCNIIDQKEIEGQISKLFDAGLIEESTSPFATPLTLAYKKYSDGSCKKDRLCIDFSALNKIIVPESQPFPLIEDLISGFLLWILTLLFGPCP